MFSNLSRVTQLIFLNFWGGKNLHFTFFFFFNLYLFIYLFMAVLGLRFCARAFSLLAASGGHSSSRCAGLSLSRPLLLRSTGSRCAGSAIVAHGPSCSAACGILPDQGSNPCPLHWQADSQPLRHQGSPTFLILKFLLFFWPHGMQDLSSLTRDRTHAPCSVSAGS